MSSSLPPQPNARAAAYLRMSSDRQELSIGTQLDGIRSYAAAHGLELVEVYEDAAKSGLSIANREGMKRLLRDVMGTPRAFDVVLVYDVSRWGRFQDIDAAAYYEYTCRMNGVRVVYVQEPFGSDIDPLTALLKTMKRAMAAEYARELGVKARAGQDRAIHMGFQMGPLPCIGLSRVAIDRWGNQRPLARHQLKAMQSERIAWVPGPQQEVELVRRIFSMYCAPGGSIKRTSRLLREDGITTPDGGRFTASVVDSLLRCEAFAGNFVWGRERYPAAKSTKRKPETRANGVLERVVSEELWARAQRKLWERRRLRRDKEQLLAVLRTKLAEHPQLNALDLEALGIHSKKAYTNAFGSVSRALELAGRDPHVVRSQHERSKVIGREVGDRLESDVAELLQGGGVDCQIHPRSRVLVLSKRHRVRLQLMWPRSALLPKRWHILKARRPASDWVLLAQMREDSTATHFMLLTVNEYRKAPAWLSETPPPTLRPLRSAQELRAAVLAAIGEAEREG